jgi:glucose-1-phosphate cytidylyltransferase
MVEIGGRPILTHIMRWYAHFGYNEFIIALGYKGEQIKQYFLNYYALNSDITVELRSGNVTVHDNAADDWVVHLVDTGAETMTGGRVRRLRKWLTDDTFMLTYGDGLSNVDLTALVAFHRQHGGLATVTAVRPPARFGELEFAGDRVTRFTEKPQTGEGWINGGFFVLNRAVLDYIGGDQTMWEVEPLHQLAKQGDLMAYRLLAADGYLTRKTTDPGTLAKRTCPLAGFDRRSPTYSLGPQEPGRAVNYPWETGELVA